MLEIHSRLLEIRLISGDLDLPIDLLTLVIAIILRGIHLIHLNLGHILDTARVWKSHELRVLFVEGCSLLLLVSGEPIICVFLVLAGSARLIGTI